MITISKKEAKQIIKDVAKAIRENDEGKPAGEHFAKFHAENRKLLTDLAKLKWYVRLRTKGGV